MVVGFESRLGSDELFLCAANRDIHSNIESNEKEVSTWPHDTHTFIPFRLAENIAGSQSSV